MPRGYKHVPPERNSCHECGATFAKKNWGRRVVLEPEELQPIMTAACRWAEHQKKTPGYKVYFRSGMAMRDMYYIGWTGEYAVHALLGLEWQPKGRPDAGFDVTWRGKRFQIKTAHGYGKDLYFQPRQLAKFKRYDGVIFVHKEKQEGQPGYYWVAGWMWMDEFLSCHHLVDTGYKPSLRVKHKCFGRHSVDELLNLGKPPGSVAPQPDPPKLGEKPLFKEDH